MKLTQPTIDFLEQNRPIYEAMARNEFAARIFNHGPFNYIMQTEFDSSYPTLMSGESERQVKLIISLYERYEAAKKAGIEITPNPSFMAPKPERRFIEPERRDTRY